MSNPATPEPPPIPNERMPVFVYVMESIGLRSEMGRRKYGTFLRPGNGRDALMDAYQEAIDLCMYLAQAIMERDHRG